MLSDTGWKIVRQSRCYVESERVVTFDVESAEEIAAFVSGVKKKMHGQVAKIKVEGLTATFFHAVDSGD